MDLLLRLAPGARADHLADEITGELRRRGIVVWLDKDATYNEFVDELAARYRDN